MYVAQGLTLMHNSNKLLLKVMYNGIKLQLFVVRFVLFPMILIRLLSCSRAIQAMKARDYIAWGVLHSISRHKFQKKGFGNHRKIAHRGFITCILRSKWHSWGNSRRKVNFFICFYWWFWVQFTCFYDFTTYSWPYPFPSPPTIWTITQR